MSDKFSKQTRSKIMSSIRGKNTKPELVIRKILWKNGYRYRIHDKKIVGKPDIVFKKKKLAVFIDGCFWHACPSCYVEPKTNTTFWKNKIKQNKIRRKLVKIEIKKTKWNVLEFWEHEVKENPFRIYQTIKSQLKS